MGGLDPLEEADLVSGVVFCSSSRWTAIEKRRQNAGSRTFAIARREIRSRGSQSLDSMFPIM
jgi:hypothetical protein